MERKLKFRAWDGKEMHQDVSPWRWDFVISNSWNRCERNTGDGMSGIGGNTAEMLVPAIRFTENMQFIGLLDKNGKEIYEGDILDEDGFRFKVVFEEKNARFFLKSIGCIQHPQWNRGIKMEIIGNIYENPDLWIP